MALFDVMIAEIGAAYVRMRGLGLGWRFLYSPRRTLEENSGFAIFGLNPGGSSFEPPMPSVEAGNAWLASIERWPSANTQNNFTSLVGKIVQTSAPKGTSAFLACCLTANIVPFRTASAAELPRSAFEWSLDFWTRHFEVLSSQRFILAVGNSGARSPFAALAEIYKKNGWSLGEEQEMPCGWGAYVLRMRRMTNGTKDVVIVGAPHFSRFETRDQKTVACLKQTLTTALL
jgi:hypothetical protein